MTLTVLLVEDDRELRGTLRAGLETEGYRVLCAASLADAAALWTHAATCGGGGDPARVDIVLLDLGLPDGDGATLLARLRREHATPVLVMSARDGDGQKIGLLDAGADDYLVKPFSLGELLARMRVALRHRGTALQPAVTQYRRGALHIELATHRVALHGNAVHLTPTEFKLLARLMRSAGQVVTHRTLLAEVWGAEFTDHTHYLRLYMGQLRAKLEADAADPQTLLTEPGVGYRMAEGDGA
jgi:two-component system KDP operon response regulator KdpE